MIGLVLIYILLFLLLFWGTRICAKGTWNDDFLSLKQTKMLQGYTAVCIMFHHMGQKTCAPWHNPRFIVHGLDVYVNIGYLFVSIFLFCSGYGLYKSYHAKQNYLDGFIKYRILPIIIAFYTSEWIFLAMRAIMGQKMDFLQVFYYVVGAQLGNYYAWYVMAIPLFYLIFYFSFRFVKKDGLALLCTAFGIFLYILIGTIVDHNDWIMKGEWWYNTAHLFIVGLVFAKFEKQIVAHVKKYYWFYLIFTFVTIFVFYAFSTYALAEWSYYGEEWHATHKVLRRWGCLFSQILTSCSFVFFVLIASMKIKIGNKLLSILGGATLEIYLIHGIFVELFGYDFLESTHSLIYIRNVPLYVLIVIVCTIPAVYVYKKLLTFLNRKMLGKS